MSRDFEAIPTWHDGVMFRSMTEAKWSAFFGALGIRYEYEPGRFDLSTGGSYLPDFWIPAFKAYLEVKPANEVIRKAERHRAEQFAHDQPGFHHWISRGAPSADRNYVEVLNDGHAKWTEGCILEDRRDEGVFWLAGFNGDMTGAQALGGWGQSTPHDRNPIETKRIRAAYMAAQSIRRIAA